jgi:hypothetical protein
MQDGDYLANGATAVQSTKPDGGYAYLKDNVLTLDNFDNEGKFNERILYTPSAYVVFSDEKIDIVLKGENKITMNNVDERHDVAIYLSRECEITGASFASLTVTGVDEGISAYELEINGGNYKVCEDNQNCCQKFSCFRTRQMQGFCNNAINPVRSNHIIVLF